MRGKASVGSVRLAVSVLVLLLAAAIVYAAACPKCGADVPATAKFCPECGAKIEAQPAPATGAILDPMDHDNGKWAVDEFGKFRGGAFHVVGLQAYYPYPFRDGLVQVDTEHVSGPDKGYGLGFRFANRSGVWAGYRLSIAANFWLLAKQSGEKLSLMTQWATSDALHTGDGARNTIGVVCHGSEIIVVINGRRIATVNDGDFADGQAGPRGAPDSDIAFRNLKIDPNYRVDVVPTAQPAQPAATTVQPAAAGQVILDPMDHDNGKWPVGGSGKFQGGAYHMGRSAAAVASYEFRDGLVQVDTEHVSGPLEQPYGLYFRTAMRAGADTGYVLSVDAKGSWALEKLSGGKWTMITPGAKSDALHTGEGARNTIGVVCHGSEITVVINGRRIATVSDREFTDGYAGVTGADDSDIAFRNLKIDPNY